MIARVNTQFQRRMRIQHFITLIARSGAHLPNSVVRVFAPVARAALLPALVDRSRALHVPTYYEGRGGEGVISRSRTRTRFACCLSHGCTSREIRPRSLQLCHMHVQQAEGRIVSTSMFTRCPQYVIGEIVVKYYVLRGDSLAIHGAFSFKGEKIISSRAPSRLPLDGSLRFTRYSRSSCNSCSKCAVSE